MPKPTVFVDAWSIHTGRKQRVPKHWFDIPALSKGLTRTEPSEDELVPPGPSEAWTNAELTAYADKHGVDLSELGSRPTKADLLDAIAPNDTGAPVGDADPHQTSTPNHPEDGTEPPDDTPTTGDEE